MNATYTVKVFVSDKYKVVGKDVSWEKAKQFVDEYESCGYYVRVIENIGGMTHVIRI